MQMHGFAFQELKMEIAKTEGEQFPSLMRLRAAGRMEPCNSKKDCPRISTNLFSRKDYMRSLKKVGKIERFTNASNIMIDNRIKTIYRFPARYAKNLLSTAVEQF